MADRLPPPALVRARYPLDGFAAAQPFSLICAHRVVIPARKLWHDTQIVATGLDASWQADRLALAIRPDGAIRLATPITFDELPRFGRKAGPRTMFIDPRSLAVEAADQLLAQGVFTQAMRDEVEGWAYLAGVLPEISTD